MHRRPARALRRQRQPNFKQLATLGVVNSLKFAASDSGGG